MKRLCVIILLLFALIGCSSKISFDSQYGVGYYLDDSGITIHLDKNKTHMIIGGKDEKNYSVISYSFTSFF